MPVQYNLPEYENAYSQEDVNKYAKLPFYLAMLEAAMFPQWQTYNTLFGKINWQPNMGSQMTGVRAEPTPVGQSVFYPNPITSLPNKDVVENFETEENAVLHLHDVDSKQFNFLPNFQDFRTNQIDFAHSDIVRQISVKNDMFIRSHALERAPYMIVAGNLGGDAVLGTKPLILAPNSGAAVTTFTANTVTKNAAFWQSAIAQVGTNLSLALVDYAVNVLRDDIGANYFEGTVNTPKDNELVKGKFVLIGSSEAYQNFKWDLNFEKFRNVNLEYFTQGFRGSIFDEVTYKTERFPLRFKADGTMPVPEIMNANTFQTEPNPEYVNAPYELAILVGADAFKTIKVGPPPKAFASGKISPMKFYSMKWNGEVTLTDQIIVKYADGTLDLNNRGRFLKFISQVVMGIIPNKRRAYLPILFARARAQV